jgi:hypothetical protein
MRTIVLVTNGNLCFTPHDYLNALIFNMKNSFYLFWRDNNAKCMFLSGVLADLSFKIFLSAHYAAVGFFLDVTSCHIDSLNLLDFSYHDMNCVICEHALHCFQFFGS